jgi:hypothetical protein
MFSRRALLPRSDARSIGMGAVRQAGCIASYGPNLQDAYRHLAVYADQILKGAANFVRSPR